LASASFCRQHKQLLRLDWLLSATLLTSSLTCRRRNPSKTSSSSLALSRPILFSNYSIAASVHSPGKSHLDFCNVTLSYDHAGTSDQLNLWYWLPAPDAFQNRFLATDGGGSAIPSGQRGMGTGLVYGAATGTTNGGFGSWNAQLTDVLLRANGTINYDLLYAFGYKAFHDMTVIGQQLTK
jgi:tannase